MERRIKNRISSLLTLLAACQLGLGVANAEVVAADSTNIATQNAVNNAAGAAKSSGVDTTLTPEALRLRGAELDNYIYEASDAPSDIAANSNANSNASSNANSTNAENSGSTEGTSIRPQTLWIAAGVACLIGMGTAYFYSQSGKTKVVYTDYAY